MKKLGLFICFVLSVFVLASCVEETPTTQTPAITFEQETLTFKVGDVINDNILLEGVKAINAKGEELKVSVYHTIPLEDSKVTKSGKYRVKYVAEEGDLILTEYRDLTVIYVAPTTDDLVVNGDLESGGTDPYNVGLFENGGGQISVITTEDGNKVLKLEMTSVAYSQGSPRIETNKFELDPTKYYAIRFTAWADQARSAHIQIGELLSAAPWYNQIGSGDWYADLTTEAKEYEFRFQPAADSAANMANAQLLFEFGTMPNGQSAVTNCYLDNIKVVEVADLGIESILKVESVLEFGEEAAAKEKPGQLVVWYDQGGWCGAPSVVATTLNEGVITIDAKQPEGSCWFAAQAFLYTGALEEANYKLTFKLNSNKAGQVTICGQVMDIVEGDNMITLDKNVAKDEIFGLAIQLGVDGSGNIGDAVVTISNILLVNNGAIKEPVQYADPENLFGNATEVVFGGEGDSKKAPNKFNVWNVQDPTWQCGPVSIVSYTYENGVLTVNSTQTAENWWFATQIFYTTLPFEKDGSHKLTFELVSNVAGEVTICGKKMAIVEGKNELEVTFDITKGNAFTFSMQLGWLEEPETSHTLVGNMKLEFSKFSIDGQVGGKDPVGPDVPPVGELTTLSKVVGIVLNDTIVAFAPVENATSYKVYIYNGEEEVYSQEVTNGGKVEFTTPGTYMVKVQALGDGKTYANSELSDPVEWKIAGADDEITLTKPVGVVCNPLGDGGYICAFAPVANAVSYKVFVYNAEGEVVHSEEITNGGKINFTTAGTYTIKVQALGNGANIKDSELSDAVNWTLE